MSNEEYRKYIREMIDQLENEDDLRKIYNKVHRYFVREGALPCAQKEDYSMGEVSKQLIIEMVKRIDDSDEKFLRQIYTILKRHLERM